jgi:hypothetical protein
VRDASQSSKHEARPVYKGYHRGRGTGRRCMGGWMAATRSAKGVRIIKAPFPDNDGSSIHLSRDRIDHAHAVAIGPRHLARRDRNSLAVTSVSCCRRGEGWSAPLGPAPHKQMGPSGLNHHPLLPLRFNPASPLTKKAFNLSAPRLLTLCCWLVVVAFHRTGGGRRGACHAARCSQGSRGRSRKHMRHRGRKVTEEEWSRAALRRNVEYIPRPCFIARPCLMRGQNCACTCR